MFLSAFESTRPQRSGAYIRCHDRSCEVFGVRKERYEPSLEPTVFAHIFTDSIDSLKSIQPPFEPKQLRHKGFLAVLLDTWMHDTSYTSGTTGGVPGNPPNDAANDKTVD
ncbi:hypothetical protein M413DRAFT_26157 [Hebeloma cylindrosporum]|uniref:Uncharacterized protein n=1 Tax=Hebeloma cylindrosporum TaxID=76867 RepID=A0A0C2Y1Y9_HEBCY|nr:hypothetical protein M413DRAFT_26157 [Hebeloma cylindrosporum h7]